MRGEPAILNGQRTDPNRTEAEYRAEHPKQRVGERFDQSERRWFREARQRFDLAISLARSAMEDANLDASVLDDHIADTVGDTWDADYRAEKE